MKIKLNKKIYPLKIVKKAINKFEYLADFNLNQKRDLIEIKIKKAKIRFPNFLEEFCNFLIYLMVKTKKQKV